jgi:hypothetical protein
MGLLSYGNRPFIWPDPFSLGDLLLNPAEIARPAPRPLISEPEQIKSSLVSVAPVVSVVIAPIIPIVIVPMIPVAMKKTPGQG